MDNTTPKIPQSLLEELEKAFQNLSYGSIEIYVQDRIVKQITVRNIKKTSVGIRAESLEDSKTNGIHARMSTASNVRIKLRP